MVVLLKVFTFLASPLGKVLGIVLAISGAFAATYIAGDQNGAARIQAKWDAAALAAIKRAASARVDAEKEIGDGELRMDKFNRDDLDSKSTR